MSGLVFIKILNDPANPQQTDEAEALSDTCKGTAETEFDNPIVADDTGDEEQPSAVEGKKSKKSKKG